MNQAPHCSQRLSPWATPAVAVLLSLAVAGCGGKPGLASYGLVPDFRLIDQQGQAFSGNTLRGKVWVANFIFTTCQGPCPRMSSQFRTIQKQAGEDSALRFVSFTIDPIRDTPTVLAEYSKRFGAQ
ncbi:MAG: SCO family protein, partial [Bryobacteraceae bacterium]|nr:SCO family protein [Bryobacteraceae bacterium]